MNDEYDKKQNFTQNAWDSFYDTVDSNCFLDHDADMIYEVLTRQVRFIPFGEYLKRYIYEKAEISTRYEDVPLDEYILILCESFAENNTPHSFTPTTAKRRAFSKNWLTQQTVKRNIVFLLGFGLSMNVREVNEFLTKALREQGINFKDPFEVICWYCYKNKYNYMKFEQLWKTYQGISSESFVSGSEDGNYTIGMRISASRISDEDSLLAHLAGLKTNDNRARISVTTSRHFNALYDKARDILAMQKNRDARTDKYTTDDISAYDIEQVLCSAIPVDKNGNLISSKGSKLNDLFAGKRFSRQHISSLVSGKKEAEWFDLITLNFFVFSYEIDDCPNNKARFMRFVDSTNKILQDCGLGPLYISNPYECFVLMCILSEYPLGTYADVWELSYGNTD